MKRDAQFACRFPAHALGLSERLGDVARQCGLVTWTRSVETEEYEIIFAGPPDDVRRFVERAGLQDLAIAT
jgi:hypothetical protein